MAIYKALHPRDDIDRLYVLRKEGIRGLSSIEDCIDASIQGVKIYTKKRKERLITPVSNSNGNMMTNRKTTKLENKNGRINNFTYTSSNKLARLHTR